MGKHRVKPRKHRQSYKEYNDAEEPLVNLATAIVGRAVHDAQALTGKEQMYVPQEATGVNKYELMNFFRSKWCGILLGTTELEGEEIIERTGLNELFDTR